MVSDGDVFEEPVQPDDPSPLVFARRSQIWQFIQPDPFVGERRDLGDERSFHTRCEFADFCAHVHSFADMVSAAIGTNVPASIAVSR